METYLYPFLLGASAHLMVGLIFWVAGWLKKLRYIIVIAVVLGTFTVMQVSVEKAQVRHENGKDWLGREKLPDPIKDSGGGGGSW